MTYIPSLTLKQLDLLRIAKQHPGETIQVSYEFPVINDTEPPIFHPPFIQKLIDARLIQIPIQVIGIHKRKSEHQQQSWAEFHEGIDHPSQANWESWRKGFIPQLDEGVSSLMSPGIGFEEFSTVWMREVTLQAIQPRKL